MNFPLFTTIFIITTTVFLIGWDVYVAFFNDVPNSKDTISGIIHYANKRISIFAFVWAFLGSHLCWGNKNGPIFGQPNSVVFAVWFAWLLFIVSLSLKNYVWFQDYGPGVYLLLGIIAGYFLWPQGY